MQLYLGNLASEVDEPLLYELISQFAPVQSVRMPKNKMKKTHQGYGFAVFYSEADGQYVHELLLNTPMKLYRRQLKVSSASHSTNTKSNIAAKSLTNISPRVFIGNLDPKYTDEHSLSLPFEKFGQVLESEIVKTNSEKYHAFITLESMEAAENCIRELNGQYLLNRRVKVELER